MRLSALLSAFVCIYIWLVCIRCEAVWGEDLDGIFHMSKRFPLLSTNRACAARTMGHVNAHETMKTGGHAGKHKTVRAHANSSPNMNMYLNAVNICTWQIVLARMRHVSDDVKENHWLFEIGSGRIAESEKKTSLYYGRGMARVGSRLHATICTF